MKGVAEGRNEGTPIKLFIPNTNTCHDSRECEKVPVLCVESFNIKFRQGDSSSDNPQTMKPGFDPIKKRHSNSRRQIPHPNPNRCCSWGISFRGRRMVYITKTTPSRQTAINPVSLKFKFKLIDSVSCYLVFSLPSSTHSGNKVVRSISLSFSHSSRQVSIAIHSYWVVTGFVIK